jgi:hypothetical protein
MNHSIRIAMVSFALAMTAPGVWGDNLCKNCDFALRSAGGQPAGYELSGDVTYRYLGEPGRDTSGYGVAFNSASLGAAGEVSQVVNGIDAGAGRWFLFSFRGLPQDGFAVSDEDLYMKVEFFGGGGKISYDAKAERIYDQVQIARRDMTVNGVHHLHGAEVWRTYQLEFYIPFPQVDQLRLSVGYGNAAGGGGAESEFFANDFSLTRVADPPGAAEARGRTPGVVTPQGNLIPLGGRWYYEAAEGESAPPREFNYTNAQRLLYHDNVYSAPFAGNMSAPLRVNEMDLLGNIVSREREILDNVTVRFDADAMIIHTHGLPNHPTGRFPNFGFGEDGNPNYIQEQDDTYYIPLNPTPNPRHFVTTLNNSNHALPMGPIGIAVNGIVFFNPFDMGNQDATDLMDRCCGHPNQDGQYHYHKYPICINSPWSDNGTQASPVIGWAFDGYPIYGPYQRANVMAKDVQGADALNAFNVDYDTDRGWHYNVTPGKFPYLIGGYWGTEDSRDMHGPRGGGGGFGGPPPF